MLLSRVMVFIWLLWLCRSDLVSNVDGWGYVVFSGLLFGLGGLNVVFESICRFVVVL